MQKFFQIKLKFPLTKAISSAIILRQTNAATWPSGKAKVCNTSTPSSNLGVASKTETSSLRTGFFVFVSKPQAWYIILFWRDKLVKKRAYHQRRHTDFVSHHAPACIRKRTDHEGRFFVSSMNYISFNGITVVYISTKSLKVGIEVLQIFAIIESES